MYGCHARPCPPPPCAVQIPLPPQHCKGCFKFVEGNPVTLRKHMAIVAMIEQMNRAIATLQPLTGAASS